MITDISRVSYKDYQEYKAALDAELQQSTESFVRIGYMLKLARDTDILKGSGYTGVLDFARVEYNIDKTLVSRFISINDRFSEDGNSDRLKEQYRGFGYAKLAIMLQLPDAVNEEITPAFSKADIQTIKDEVDAERQVTAIEVLIEPKNEAQEAMESNLDKAVYQLGHDNPELYAELMAAVEADGEAVPNAIQEALAPSGEGIYSVRIMGAGRLLLSVKDLERDITLTNVRTGDKESYTWEQMEAAIGNIMVFGGTVKDSYMAVYDERFPVEEKTEEKKKIAPVQPKVEKPKNRSKVTKAAKPVPKRKEAPFKTVEPEQERIASENVEIVEEMDENRINAECETNFEENETETVEIDTEKAPKTAEILNAEPDGRLTESDDFGNWGVRGLPWKELQVGQVITQEISDKLYGCLCKLKDYEETGLKPEEVEKMMEESRR